MSQTKGEKTLTENQVQSLQSLLAALENATDSGALDKLQSECGNPDSINDVCAAVTTMLGQAGHTQSSSPRNCEPAWLNEALNSGDGTYKP